MLTVQIRNQEIEREFRELVNVFGTEELAWEEVFKFMQIYFLVFASQPIRSREQQFHALLEELRGNVQHRGAFAGLTHDEILAALRRTRDEIWETEYQQQYENFIGH